MNKNEPQRWTDLDANDLQTACGGVTPLIRAGTSNTTLGGGHEIGTVHTISAAVAHPETAPVEHEGPRDVLRGGDFYERHAENGGAVKGTEAPHVYDPGAVVQRSPNPDWSGRGHDGDLSRLPEDRGRYVTEPGTPPEKLNLPPGGGLHEPTYYEVRPGPSITGETSQVGPAFGKGTQDAVQTRLDNGISTHDNLVERFPHSVVPGDTPGYGWQGNDHLVVQREVPVTQQSVREYQQIHGVDLSAPHVPNAVVEPVQSTRVSEGVHDAAPGHSLVGGALRSGVIQGAGEIALDIAARHDVPGAQAAKDVLAHPLTQTGMAVIAPGATLAAAGAQKALDWALPSEPGSWLSYGKTLAVNVASGFGGLLDTPALAPSRVVTTPLALLVTASPTENLKNLDQTLRSPTLDNEFRNQVPVEVGLELGRLSEAVHAGDAAQISSSLRALNDPGSLPSLKTSIVEAYNEGLISRDQASSLISFSQNDIKGRLDGNYGAFGEAPIERTVVTDSVRTLQEIGARDVLGLPANAPVTNDTIAAAQAYRTDPWVAQERWGQAETWTREKLGLPADAPVTRELVQAAVAQEQDPWVAQARHDAAQDARATNDPNSLTPASIAPADPVPSAPAPIEPQTSSNYDVPADPMPAASAPAIETSPPPIEPQTSSNYDVPADPMPAASAPAIETAPPPIEPQTSSNYDVPADPMPAASAPASSYEPLAASYAPAPSYDPGASYDGGGYE